jgi:hypothetical protein
MKIRKLLVLGSTLLFVSSLMVFTTSCGGSKEATTAAKGPKIKSGSGMGNQKQKNKHVWGK